MAKSTPTITWDNPAPITYGTPLGATQLNAVAPLTPVGLRFRQGGTFTYSPPAGTVLNVGNNQTLSVTFTPTEIEYYGPATAKVSIDVQQLTPTITWDNPAPITVGTPLGAVQLGAIASRHVPGAPASGPSTMTSESVPGTFTYSPPAGTVLPLGNNQMLSVKFTPTNTAGYTTASATVAIDVTPVPIVIAFDAPGTAITGRNDAPLPGALSGIPTMHNLLQVTGVYGEAANGVGVGGGSNTGVGVYGSSNSDSGVQGSSTSGTGVIGTSGSGTGVEGQSTSFDGVSGTTASPQHAGVSAHNTGGGFGLWAQATTAGFFEGNVQVNGNANVTGEAVLAALQVNGNANVTGEAVVTALQVNGNANVTGETVVTALQVNGNANVTGDVVLTGADCAEDFDVAAEVEVEPGTVMVIDDREVLRPSSQPYDRRVAGVVSGAGAFKPALLLDRRASSHKRRPVALVGKVYCNVDASYGPIDVGDLLTTSLTPGHAMKAADPAQAFGAVIGKALRPLKSGRGLVPILVALQ